MKKLLLAGMAIMLLHFSSFALLVTPAMVSPAHGTTGAAVNVMLDWGTSTGATYYEYKLSTSPTLAGATATSTGANSYFYTADLKFNTTYYWAVRARSATDSSNWTVIYSFTTMDGIGLASPSNGATNQYVDVLLDWGTVSGCTYYDVEYDTSATFASPMHHVQSYTSSYTSAYTADLLFGQTYYWRARARHSADTTTWSAVWSFTTTNNISPVSPSNGATNQYVDVLLDWSTVSGCSYYDVEYDTSATFASPLHHVQSYTSSYTSGYTANLLFGQKYYWKVRARHSADTTSWSSVWSFTTGNNISPVSPANGATNQYVDVLLDWSTVSGCSYYDVEYDTSATFASPLHHVQSYTSSYTSGYTANLLFGQTYYWKVRARHSADTTSWSSVWSFTTTNNISPVSPSNGATNQDVDVLLDWSTVSGCSYYDVEYDTSATFASPLHHVQSYTSSYTSGYTAGLLFGTKYYWRVRARHSADTTAWSAVWNFTTHNAMTLSLPGNGAINQNVDVTLDWSAISGITHYDVEYDTTASFNSPLHQVQTTVTGYSSYAPGNMLFGTTYYWRARSRHAADTSVWSATWSFTTMNGMALSLPANGATNQAVNVNLDWAAINGITHYDVEYDTTASFNSPLHQVQTTLTGYSNYTPGNLLFATTYYWRARSRHSADTSTWSSVWSFTTTDGKPAHVSPANAATGVSLNPTIDWSVVSGITLYQYEYSADPTFSSATPTSAGTTSQAGLSNLSYGQTYYWRVRTCHPVDTSDWSNPWSFTTLYQLTSPVVLSSPANGTTGIGTSTVNMSWQSYATAVFYEYMYADNASFTNAVSGSAVATSQITAPLMPGTTYYWKVRANNGSGYSPWSDVWTFATSGLAVPVLISPANGATDQPLSITLDWQDAAAATFYEYELDDDVMFGSPIASGSPTISNAAVSSLAYNTTYYWRVRSSDGTNFSAWCSPWSFTTTTLTAPTLITPANGASNQAVTNLLLDWSDISGASMYEYYYDTDINFTNPTHAIVTVSQVTITGLSNNTSYFWKVRSSDGAIYSPYSAIWSFTTETGVGIEENETNILLYPNPANENATLQFGNAAERTIRVISPTGQVVREISTNEAHFNLDLSGMNSGLYMVIIAESKEMKTLRLTIE